MQSISCDQLAREVLGQCIAGNPPERLPQALVDEPCAKALFGILVEGLSDRFEPALCDCYARLFSQAIVGADGRAAVAMAAMNAMHAPAAMAVRDAMTPAATDAVAPAAMGAMTAMQVTAVMVARYERVRRARPVVGEPARVLVLSRVTLGADIAVTSVLLAAAKRRFPNSAIVFAGPRKNFEMFAGDPRLSHAPIEYRRGSPRERLTVWDDLKALATGEDCVVIDADSRLTQLGLLPLGNPDRYHLFESRGYGGTSDRTLPDLAAQWAEETFGVAGAKPYVAPVGQLMMEHAIDLPRDYIAISLGVGENPAKRIPDPFEEELLRLLATRAPLVIDRGAGGEEAVRVERAAGRNATFWEGSFAGFAKIIAGSSLYVGYDSAGQHVASACGVPLISIFAGWAVPRMFDRWRPQGTVIRVDRPDPVEILERVRAALPPMTTA